MARLYRPYIPLAVRVQVAERQMRERGLWYRNQLSDWALWPNGVRLAAALKILFGDRKFALDHDPALMNRKQRRVTKLIRGKLRTITIYSPPANDPRYLIYRAASDHDIKTRVRGDGAQLSDLAIARKRKRKLRNLDAKKLKHGSRFIFTGVGRRPTYRWPSRPFPKRRF